MEYHNISLNCQVFKEHPFINGCIDHTPTENIELSNTYTSVCLFYTSDFHSRFRSFLDERNITLRPWKRSKAFYKIIPSLNEADLPFFAFAQTVSGEIIYQSKAHFIKELDAAETIVSKNSKNGIEDIYKLIDGKTGETISIEYKEKISISILYISHFILRSIQIFKSICNSNKIPIVESPFQIFHDKFPGWHDKRGEIIPAFINQNLGRDFNFCHWNSAQETVDDLLVDNMCGYLSNIRNNSDPILPVNVLWEKWE